MSSDLVADLIVEGVRDDLLTRPVHVVRDFKLGFGLRRLFVAFHGSISGFDYCRPLLFLDGTFFKGRFRGNLLAAIGKDGNQDFFPVCFGIVGSENQDNWHRNLGLVEVLPKVFLMAFHAYCLYHLKMNLRHHLCGMFRGLKEKLITVFRKCAYAPTEETFHQCLVELKTDDGPRVEKFLDDIPYDHWSNAYFRGQRFGEMWSNVAEFFNLWIREERHMPITKLIDSVRIKLMRKIAKMTDLVNKWNGVICPKIESKLHNAFNTSRPWIVSSFGNDVYEVLSHPSVSVDISRRICSCGEWQLKGFPCAQGVGVIQKSGHDLSLFVGQYFYVQSYRESYYFSIYPLPSVWKPDCNADGESDVVLPLLSRKQPGRPNKKRICSNGEKVRQITYGRCGKVGNHNKKSCKEALCFFVGGL
ncbi:uncharacterized protein LOC114263144 [Camellia sinensis]|uniref:uncharacterized protein LOC114263144 n=1 Tax=Camellia sinensis TaxID=4442 RepID=UPI00103623A3|nr:uncharacterized protein LOC114263144 [Camellia sinensis]